MPPAPASSGAPAPPEPPAPPDGPAQSAWPSASRSSTAAHNRVLTIRRVRLPLRATRRHCSKARAPHVQQVQRRQAKLSAGGGVQAAGARTGPVELEGVPRGPLARVLAELAHAAGAEEVDVGVDVLPHRQQLERRHEALAVVRRKVVDDLHTLLLPLRR
jgi:hypothetical protein